MPDPILSAPVVSVITVTYNSSGYVRDAIESVLGQSYTNLEYIIGDDCSTDGTWDIIGNYRDRRIKAYRNEKNIGEYANRNKAISLATGEYLIFIDGDDVIYKYGIELYLRMALDHPDAAIVITKGYTNNVIFPYLMEPKETMLNHFFAIDPLQSSFVSNFFLTKAVKKIAAPKEYIQGDQYLRLAIAIEYPVLLIGSYLTWHRETPGQASSKLEGLGGIQEIFRMSRETLNRVDFFDNQFKRYCIYKAESMFFRASLRYILRLRIGHVLKHWKLSGISLRKLIREYFYFRDKRIHVPTLADHDAGNPAKYKKI